MRKRRGGLEFHLALGTLAVRENCKAVLMRQVAYHTETGVIIHVLFCMTESRLGLCAEKRNGRAGVRQ